MFTCCLPESLTHKPLLASLAASFFALVPLTSAFPARAAQSQVVETAGGSVRLVLGAPQPGGQLPAILDIRLEPGWKTYWRDPGMSGIPPEVTIEDGPLRLNGLRLPPPRRLGEGQTAIIGYDRPVAFPLALDGALPGRAIEVTAEVFVGICKEICIPVSATLSATVPADGTTAPLDQARIDAAVRALPAMPSHDFFVERAAFDASRGLLSIALRVPAEAPGQPVELFLSGGEGTQFGAPREMGREGGIIRYEVPLRAAQGGPAPAPPGAGTVAEPAEGPILLVARAGGRSIETSLAFD